MAWNFARYIGRVVEAGKAEYPIPMITNCPQDGFREGRPRRSAEADRAAAAMPDAMDVWRAGAPQIDLFGGRHLQHRLRGVLRQVHPIRQPAVHRRDGRRELDVKASALRLRTPRRHGLSRRLALTAWWATPSDLSAMISSRNWRP